MKMRKNILICCLLFLFLFLCAFGMPSTATILLQSESNEAVQLNYISAEHDSEILSLMVDFETNVECFEIANNIVVATDEAMTNKLKALGVRAVGNNLIYDFTLTEPVERIYIAPPTLYIPCAIDEVTMPLISNINYLDRNVVNDDEWFTITSALTEVIDEDCFAVVVNIDPINDMLPRFPRLIIDGEVIGGFSSLVFDSNNIFESGQFCYYFPLDQYDEITSKLGTASLTVENALIKVSANQAQRTSSIRSLVVN